MNDEEKDRERIRQQEILFAQYEHYQREMQRILIEKHDCENKIVELKAKILEVEI